MNLGEIWEELDQATPTRAVGTTWRRIYPEATCNLFLVVRRPSGERMLAMVLSNAGDLVGTVLPGGRGIAVSLAAPGQLTEGYALQAVLLDSRFSDVFTALVDDVAGTVAAAIDEAAGTVAFVQRLMRWQRFLEKGAESGLSRPMQQGLYGELWFLQERLIAAAGAGPAIAAWTGPTCSAQDFQIGGSAIEVKASMATQPQRLTINSERQLDRAGLQVLFLFHISLDVRAGAGESLPDVVERVRVSLHAEPGARDLFEDRLVQAGYLGTHAPRYADVGYVVRDVHLFRVTEHFPRIVEADLRAGVGDVRYSIGVSDCMPFLVEGPVLGIAVQGDRP